MAGELERLLIRIEADTAQLRRALANADRDVGQFASRVDRSTSRVEARFRGLMAGFSTAYAGREIARLADQFQNMENRLAVVARSAGDLEYTQRRLGEIAQETRVGVTDTAEMYARYAFALKDAGKTTNELLDFTRALQKAVVLSGASTSEAAGALRQFSQGLAADALRGQELNSVMEQMPPLADLIARSLGVTTGELRKLAEQGKITREVAFNAVMEGMTELDERFQKTEPTITQGFTQMRNALFELGEASGVFDVLTKSMQGWAKVFTSTTSEIKKSAASLPEGPGMMGAGVKLQGNIRPPKREATGAIDPWAASIIPPSYEEQLREFRDAWEEIHEVQTLALGDLIGDATETAANKMAALTDAVKAGEIGWRDYLSGVEAVNSQTTALMDDMASQVSSTLTSVFNESKTAAIAAAIIDTYAGINKALAAYPPPYSYAMAAMTAAKGFATVANIRSTSKSGGGSVGASAGATSASAPPAAPQAMEQHQTLTVRGLDAGSLFDAKSVRGLADKLIQFQRDGGKVILA